MESKAVVAIHKNPNGDTRTAPEKFLLSSSRKPTINTYWMWQG